jgi:enamidase
MAFVSENEPTREPSQTTATPTLTSGKPLVLANGIVIDGTGSNPIPNGRVVIQGNKIVAVGPTTDVSLPSNAKVIDVGGNTIMPGIINAHVHYSSDPVVRHNLLMDGVTSVCDLGSPLRAIHNFERELDWYNRPTARGFKAGPILAAPGGYPATVYGSGWHYGVSTLEEAEAAVLEILDRGVDVIKIALEPGDPQNPWPVLGVEQVQAIVDVAHAHNIPVRAHVRRVEMLDIALDAGVDVIEHIPAPFCLEADYKRVLEDDALELAKFPKLEAQLARMVKQNVVLVPTFEVNTYVVHRLPKLQPEERQYIDNFFLEIVGRFHEMGGVVALGNDYGVLSEQRGMPIREMQLLLQAGLSPMEVIGASTRHAAQISGHGDELGTLEPGKLADVIIVHGNPLNNLEAMGDVLMVIKDGEFVYPLESTAIKF